MRELGFYLLDHLKNKMGSEEEREGGGAMAVDRPAGSWPTAWGSPTGASNERPTEQKNRAACREEEEEQGSDGAHGWGG